MVAFIISPVKNIQVKEICRIDDYIEKLKRKGFTKIHFPYKHTNQKATEVEICSQNRQAIIDSDEVFIYYSKDSVGSIFDLGMAFALGKKITVINSNNAMLFRTDYKSFSNLLLDLK